MIKIDDIEIDRTLASEEDIIPVVTQTALKGNYPNPFNPETSIAFDLANEEHVSIDIYNIKGQKVKTLANDRFGVGSHSIVWNGKDDSGKNVGSGIYFYNMKSGKYTSTRKMILMK
jgi:flagellar hook assembly protein FlgD